MIGSLCLALGLIGACSSEGGAGAAASGGTGSGTGGSSSSGGTQSSGGNASGGQQSAGGTQSFGGNTSTGGQPGATGGQASGGNAVSGGNQGSGGSVSKGGSSGAGGATSSGGNVTSGGAKTGGSVGTGGTVSSGGSAATGGAASTGGVSGTGGTSAYDTMASKGEFSFFAVSLTFIRSKAGCTDGSTSKTCAGGLGGDLRNGKSNGIDGADSLCAEAAQKANPGDKHLWRAFLSAGSYNGAVLNAIDRVGTGPWYSAPPKYQSKSSYASDGLLVASNKSGLLQTRPTGDTSTIVYYGVNQSQGSGTQQSWPFSQCLLNEYGNCIEVDGDTHDTLTGSKADGTYAGTTSATCSDWTNSTVGSGAPAFGHAWPRQLNATDTAANWINTGEAGEIGCGAIINVGTTNYMSGGGMGGGGAYAGGVGSCGGYGAFYCFAYISGAE